MMGCNLLCLWILYHYSVVFYGIACFLDSKGNFKEFDFLSNVALCIFEVQPKDVKMRHAECGFSLHPVNCLKERARRTAFLSRIKQTY